MHEIITLQLGQPSNYLATHFWNAQESYFTYADDQESAVDHDVHFRAGIGADGSDTYMPRTVIYDLKGGFGSLRKVNALYDVQPEDGPEAAALWNSAAVVQRQDPIPVAAYQQSLERGEPAAPLTPADVRYWSDFNRVYLHPRSAVQLSDYELNSSLRPFERWSTGGDLFADLDREHDLLDRDLRPFLEEADHMQGIQLFTTVDDAWAGFAARYAERLRDEHSKSVLWVWALQDAGGPAGASLPREKRMLRLSNKAHALTELYRHASMIVSLSLPRPLAAHRRRLAVDAASPWHTSALLTAALETAALPSRARHGPASDRLDGMTEWLNVMGRQTIANLQMDVAPPEPRKGPAADATARSGYGGDDDHDAPAHVDLPIDLTASDDLGPRSRQNGYGRKKRHVFGQTVSIRGIPANENQTVQGARFAREYRPGERASVRSYYSDLEFPQPDSFPAIFKSTAGEEPIRGPVPLVASLTTDSSTADRLRQLRTTVARSIGVEDRESLGNELAQMADEYHDGWSSGSDDDDDDS